jgi:hypothetical protein
LRQPLFWVFWIPCLFFADLLPCWTPKIKAASYA